MRNFWNWLCWNWLSKPIVLQIITGFSFVISFTILIFGEDSLRVLYGVWAIMNLLWFSSTFLSPAGSKISVTVTFGDVKPESIGR